MGWPARGRTYRWERVLGIVLSLCTAPLNATAQQPPPEASQQDDTPVDPSAASDAEAAAPHEPAAAAEPPLVVAVAGSAPFVLRDDDGKLGGFSIELWRALAEGQPTVANAELVPFDGVEQALEAVHEGRADAALGPISITAQRAERLSFSQPYYLSALSILAPATESLWARLAPFATRAFAAGLLFLLLVLAGVGTLLWLSERRANPEQFPASPLRGIGNGIWLALVTMTTVGYGDLSPVTRGGRAVAGVWMLIAMLTASSLTASIATALTLSQLETPGISSAADLDGKLIATVPDSPAARFVREAGGRTLEVDDVDEGIAAVEAGRAKALVWDRPVLAYYLRRHPESELSLSPTTYQTRGYGIAAPHGRTDLLRAFDLGILGLLDAGKLETIRSRWLPD